MKRRRFGWGWNLSLPVLIVIAGAVGASLLMRQIPTTHARMPDLLAFSFLADWLDHTDRVNRPALELVVPTALYLVGVALLAVAVSASLPAAIRDRDSNASALPWAAAIAATLAASLPSIDSVTLLALELPGMVIALLFVYLVSRAGIAFASPRRT